MMSRSINDVLDDMVQFTKDHPTHGFNSAGKDEYLREVRRMLSTPELKAEFRYVASVVVRST